MLLAPFSKLRKLFRHHHDPHVLQAEPKTCLHSGLNILPLRFDYYLIVHFFILAHCVCVPVNREKLTSLFWMESCSSWVRTSTLLTRAVDHPLAYANSLRASYGYARTHMRSLPIKFHRPIRMSECLSRLGGQRRFLLKQLRVS